MVTVLGQVHDAIMVAVLAGGLAPVHNDLLLTVSADQDAPIMLPVSPHHHVVTTPAPPHHAPIVTGVQTRVILAISMVTVPSVHHPTSHLQRNVILLDSVHSVEMTVKTVLTCILLATLRTDHVGILILEMDILDVSL